MTAKYLITSQKFGGSLLMEYKDGILWKVEFSKDFNASLELRTMLAKKIRINEEDVDKWHENPSLTFTQLLNDTSFEVFYKNYPRKDGKKLQAEKMFNRLTEAERVQAITYIDKLIDTKNADGTAFPYASTYLSQKYWL